MDLDHVHYYVRGDYDTSIKILEKNIDNGSPMLLFNINSALLLSLYNKVGEYEKTITKGEQYFNDSLKIYYSLNGNIDYKTLYFYDTLYKYSIELMNANYYLNNYDNALKYMEKAIFFNEKYNSLFIQLPNNSPCLFFSVNKNQIVDERLYTMINEIMPIINMINSLNYIDKEFVDKVLNQYINKNFIDNRLETYAIKNYKGNIVNVDNFNFSFLTPDQGSRKPLYLHSLYHYYNKNYDKSEYFFKLYKDKITKFQIKTSFLVYTSFLLTSPLICLYDPTLLFLPFTAKFRFDIKTDHSYYYIDCLVKQNKYSEALKEVKKLESYVSSKSWFDIPESWYYDKLFGEVYRENSHYKKSIDHYKRAFEKIDKLRMSLDLSNLRVQFYKNKNEINNKLISLLIKTEQYKDAFEYFEKSKSRTFLDIINIDGNKIAIHNKQAKVLYNQKEKLVKEETKLQLVPTKTKNVHRAIKILKEKKRNIDSSIKKIYPEITILQSNYDSSLTKLKKSLENYSYIIEYFISDNFIFIWVISSDKFNYYKINYKKDKIINVVNKIRNNLGRTSIEHIESELKFLYNLLFKPINAFIYDAKRLCIIPHGVLHYLPFQILKDNDNRYLVERHTIYYSPSASVDEICRTKKRTQKELYIFAIANPDFNNSSLLLKYAEHEVNQVKKLYPNSTICVGKDASIEKYHIHAPNHKILHVAAHGIYNSNNPMQSYLLLLGKNEHEKGKLSVTDIFNSQIHTYLVFLSACDTAIGKLISGDELISMNRAFLYAGTPSVISTLWKIDDKSTSELVTEFYKNLSLYDKATSLRLAQIQLINKYKHPYYWGAFILIGDWY